MSYEEVTVGGFSVIGIAVKTINKDGQSQTDIGGLWSRFMGQQLAEKIPNRLSSEIYCIYTDYEGDFTGAYTTILGCKVSSLDVIPEGFVGREIPETPYKHYTAVGQLPYCVGKAWGEIWQSGVDRKYLADFDVYGERAQHPQHAEVDIYLS